MDKLRPNILGIRDVDPFTGVNIKSHPCDIVVFYSLRKICVFNREEEFFVGRVFRREICLDEPGGAGARNLSA